MTVIAMLLAVASCEQHNASCLLQVSASSSLSRTEPSSTDLVEHNSSALNASSRGCIYVGILSGPNNTKKRQALRDTFLKRLSSQDPNDAHEVIAEFVIGHGDFPQATQGAKPTDETLEMEKGLLQERAKHGDIRRVPLLDDYKRLTDKVYMILEHGVQRECSLIVKLDDDRSLNVELVKEMAASLKPGSLLYTGTNLWSTQAYTAQAGADGKFVQYFGGPAYALSYELASLILKDGNYANEFMTYGSKSEDVDMGRWVHEQDKPPGTVEYLVKPKFATAMEQ